MDKHRPPHIYKDDTIYFITSSTLDKMRYFDSDQKKGILLDVIRIACKKFVKELSAWIILDNHYHILVEINKGRDIPQLVNNIHANSSRLLNKLENSTVTRPFGYYSFDERALSGATPLARWSSIRKDAMRRQIWYQYFDRCIRDEKDYWARFNYVHHNCVKHGYTKSMEEYKYSSYNQWVNDKSVEWMRDVFSTYPIIDFSVEGEVD